MKKEVTQKYCQTCIHAVPDMENLSIDKKPILATCPYKQHKVLLNYDCCENHKN